MNKIFKCENCKRPSDCSMVCPYCYTNSQVELKSIERNARKAKKCDKLVYMLSFCYGSVSDAIHATAAACDCAEHCPVTSTCPRNKPGVNYCRKQITKWFRSN